MGFIAGVLHGTKKGFVRWNILCMGEGTAAGHAGTRCVGLGPAVREGGQVSWDVGAAGLLVMGDVGGFGLVMLCWADRRSSHMSGRR